MKNSKRQPNLRRPKTKIFVLAGQSNMEGRGAIGPHMVPGTLDHLYRHNPDTLIYSRLKDAHNAWCVQKNVWVEFPGDYNTISGPLTVGQGYTPRFIGPELGFGLELGDVLDENIVIIKAAWGGKNLAVDFRPPRSGCSTGHHYHQLLVVVENSIGALLKRGQLAPGDFEIAGFGWHQGWSDGDSHGYMAEYQHNLANLIRDLRDAWDAPQLPVVIATTGHGGFNPEYPQCQLLQKHVHPAQLAVAGDPEFAATVKAIDTRALWRAPAVSPAGEEEGHHWHTNAESYYLMGIAMGKAVISLL